MEHELEIKLSAQMNDVIKTLDNLTNKLKDGAETSDKYQKGIDTIVDELKKLNKGLENADSTTKFISKLKQLMGAVDKLNDVDVTNFRTNITNLFNTLQDVVANTVFVDNGFYKIATSLNRVVNGAMKINELDISLFREQFKELNNAILEMTKENENFANYDNSGYDKLVSSLTKVVNSAYKLNGVDLSAFRQQLIGVNETTYNVMKQFENIESNDVSKIIGRIANSVNRLNKIDLRKTYGTFQSLIRIIDPFLEKINASATALYTFNEVAKSLQSSATSVRVINNEFTKYDKTVKSATNSTGLFSVSMNRLYRIFRSVFSLFMSGQQKIIDYTESLNLFNVVMGNTDEQMSELGQKALYFQNTMAEAFGANTQTQLDYQAQYQAIAESMGIQEKYAYIISENLTKLSYDLSSLYNKTQDEVAKALQSGLVGQTRPVRTYGMDITQNSLTPVLESLGITDRTISDLTQAEKEILRYIAIIRQSSIAHGDLANTIESPSNQLKILKNQLVECQRWFSALFINTFAKALPYINGVVMAVKELMRALATLFGIEITDYNSGIATYSDSYADALDDVTDSADSASKAVKELTLQTLGFDQINNINENKSSGSSGSSGGSGGVGGIDQRLLDAMEGYDNAMESVRMKATEIRDKIMDWLGFTKEVDEETGKIIWKLKKGYTNIEKIRDILIVTAGIWTVAKIIKTGIALAKVFETTKLLGLALSSVFTGTSSVSLAGTQFASLSSVLATVNTQFGLLASSLGLTSLGLLGIIGAVIAIAGALIYAYQTNDTFREKVNLLGSNIAIVFTEIYDAITNFVTSIIDTVLPIWEIFKNTIVTAVKYMYESVVLNFSLILDYFNGTFAIIMDLINGDVDKMFKDAGKMCENLYNDWKTWFSNIRTIFGEFTEKMVEKTKDFSSEFVKKSNGIINWFEELPNKAFYWFGKMIGTTYKLITETNWVELGLKILNGIINGISNFEQKFSTWSNNLFNNLKNAINNINWGEIGRYILDGIKNGWMKRLNTVKSWGSSLLEGIKDGLGIHSPSKLAIPIGIYTVMGIEEGMDEELQNVPKTASKLIDTLQTTFESGMNDLSITSAMTPTLNQSTANISSIKTNFDYNSIENASYNGFVKAIKQYGLVQVNVRQDKSSIVETAINGINDITKQTGESPIEMW